MVEAKNKNINYIYGNVAYDYEPAKEPQRVIKPNKKKQTQIAYKFKLMGRIIIVFMLSFLLVYRFTVVMKLTYDIRDTKAQIMAINNENENIRIDLAQLNNIKKIEQEAISKCGMIIPVPSDVKYVSVKPLTASSEKYSQNTYQMIQKLLGLIY